MYKSAVLSLRQLIPYWDFLNHLYDFRGSDATSLGNQRRLDC